MSTSELAHVSIAEIPEDKLVARLLADPIWPHEFFELSGMPRRMRIKQCVPLNGAPGDGKGDIDVLRVAPEHPEQAVAFQIKRIKFGIPALRPGGKPNKLQELEKATQQANLLARLGFWQVYLYVIIVVDAREQNAGRTTYEGLSSKLKSLVSTAISTAGLDQRVGLCQLELTQPTDHAPLTVGSHGLHLRRLSVPSPQSRELTDWVAGIFSKGLAQLNHAASPRLGSLNRH